MTEEQTQVQPEEENFTQDQKLDLLAVNVLHLISAMQDLATRLRAVEDYLGEDAEEEALSSEGPSNASH